MITDTRLLGVAVAAGLATPLERKLWERWTVDPFGDLTDDERDEAVLRASASGAWAVCPAPTVLIDDRPVPVPPGHRRKRSS